MFYQVRVCTLCRLSYGTLLRHYLRPSDETIYLFLKTDFSLKACCHWSGAVIQRRSRVQLQGLLEDQDAGGPQALRPLPYG